MKTIYFLFAMAIASLSVNGQVLISPGATVTQDFSIGTSATATMPSGWKTDKSTAVRTVGTYAGATTATERQGGNDLSSSAANGIYNFGAGAADAATDRAVGGLSSGSASKSVNVYVQLQNSGTTTINNFTIGYAVEKYRNGSNAAGYFVQLYYSTDGSTWTSAGSNFLTSFSADADNSGYTSAPGATMSVTGQTLNVSLAASANLYLAWNYSVISGSTTSNAQGLAIDDISIKANAVSSSATSATDYFRSAASGSWTSASSWESSADGSTNWIAATLTPTSAANTIIIRNGHTIAISSAGLSLDQTVIEQGGQLTVDAGVTFTLADGPGTDLDIFGVFLNAGGAHTWTGKMALQSGGNYIHTTTASADDAYNAASLISPTSTWTYRASSSVYPSTTFQKKTYGHLRLEAAPFSPGIGAYLSSYDSCFTNDFYIGPDAFLSLNGTSEFARFVISGNFTCEGKVDPNGYFSVAFTGMGKTISNLVENGNSSVYFAEAAFTAGSAYTLATELYIDYTSGLLDIREGSVLDAAGFRVVGGTFSEVNINGTLRTAHATNAFAIDDYFISFGPASTIHYNGSGTQVFLSRNDYGNVEISGGSNKTLEGNAKLSGTLTLTNGKVILGANNLEVGTGVTGGSSSNYVVTDGTGALTINNVGSSAKIFPVGPSTSLYHPATISNAGTMDNFSVKVSSADLPCIMAPKAVKATWDIAEATAGGSDCTITLDYTGAATGSSYYPLSGKIIHCNGTTKDYSNGSVTGTVATGSGFTSFSPFGIAVDDEGGPLPVKFANVKAAEQSNGTLISWSNLTETDVKDYTVEYSANGNNFIAIGSVNARSNNDGREDYSFLHTNVSSTVSYYRIGSEEFSGLVNYSIVVKVDRRKGQTLVSVYPNPSSGADIVMQATDLAKGRYMITVYAANGQQVAAQTLNHNGGSVTEPVLIPSTLKAGMYTLLLQSAETKITSRFVVR